MKIDRYYLFEPLMFTNGENEDIFKQLLYSGRSINIIKFGHNLNLYRPGQIVKSPWGDLLEVRTVTTHENLDNVNLPTSILSKKVIDNIKKFLGKFDIIELFPICALVFFIPSPRYNFKYEEPYYHCGIIYDNKVYESWNLLNTKITPFSEKEQFFFNSNTVFFATSIDVDILNKEIVTGCNPIEFVTRCVGLSKRRFNETLKQKDSRYFTTYLELYNFLKGRRNDYGAEY